jgi:predicted dehydrogenase
MPEMLTVAIIGAGQIAGGYDRRKNGDDGVYSHSGAYLKDGRFILETVADTDAARAELFRKEWQFGSAAASVEEICRRRHDVVSVCTPDANHFETIRSLIEHRCCRTIFAEKPLALGGEEIAELITLARENDVNIVVNFQRRFDPTHAEIRQLMATGTVRLLAGNAYYIKGLEHIGTTMIDTINFLCGTPRKVLAFNRVFNREANEYSYEFILFYDDSNITVKTVDSNSSPYNYHIFEIDLLFADRRITINDNSRQMVVRKPTGYAYSGVKVLDDRQPCVKPTGYSSSMSAAVNYIHRVTTGKTAHTVNTPETSAVNKLIVDAIVASYEQATPIDIGENPWNL